jgi:phospholipid N-methyltransferase
MFLGWGASVKGFCLPSNTTKNMKKNKIKTALAYTKHFFTTGAFAETKRETEVEICSKLPKGSGKIIVEYGMGHGNISKEVLRVIAEDSKLYCFEVNKEFCELVRKEIPDERLVIINDSAENAKLHLPGQVDAFIGSIPFSFFSKEVANQILQDAYDLLSYGGYYSQVLYTKFNYKKFTKVFDECERVKIPALPPEYIFHCCKVEKG